MPKNKIGTQLICDEEGIRTETYYLGIYSVLDLIQKRMEESKPLGDFERYAKLYIELYSCLFKIKQQKD